MPPPFPTTSPVAVATTRILAAYLSNHKLSPAEAVGLSGTIAQVLASLAAGTAVKNVVPLAEQAPKRQAKPRAPRRVRADVAEPSVPLEPEAALSEPVPEPDPEPVVELDQDFEPEADPEPAAEPEAQAAAFDDADGPRKRKRPSRPRSKRGKGAGGVPADAAMLEEQPEDEVVSVAPDRESTVEPAVEERASEAPTVAPKPRRTTSRVRRATT